MITGAAYGVHSGLREQPGGLATLLGQYQRDYPAGSASPGGAATTMQIVLRRCRRIDVDYQIHVVDVDAARRKRCRSESLDGAVTEPIEGTRALRL